MTFVGKVLVVVNVVMTVCIAMFAAGVFAVQTSWRDKFNNERTLRERTVKDKDDAISAKDRSIADLNQKWKDAENRAGNAEAKVTRLTTELETASANHKKTLVNYVKQNALYQVLDDENKVKRSELANLRKALDQLHTKLKKLSADITKLEDEKYGLTRSQKQIETKYNEMLETLVAYRKTLQLHKIKFDAAAVAGRDVLPDPAEGIVTDVIHGNRDKATLVEISVGKDDGVTEGLVMHVYRLTNQGKYLGKLKVTSVSADKAYCVLVDNAKQGLIQKGDHVAAKLKF